MRADQRLLPIDLRVMKGATSWTDENMLSVRLKIGQMAHCWWREDTSRTP